MTGCQFMVMRESINTVGDLLDFLRLLKMLNIVDEGLTPDSSIKRVALAMSRIIEEVSDAVGVSTELLWGVEWKEFPDILWREPE